MAKMMYGDLVVYCIVVLCLRFTWCLSNLDFSHNIICQPLPQVVAVNGNGLPYFVELHQCQGQIENHDPRIKKCTFKTSEDVRVKIVHSGHRNKYVILKNHTSCKEQCSITCPDFYEHDSNCGCTICPHTAAPVGHECPKDFIWDRDMCKCKCNLKGNSPPRGKTFNKTQCKYVCRSSRPCTGGATRNPDTCRCPRTSASTGNEDSGNMPQGKLIAIVVIAEFFLLLFIFDVYSCSKKRGLMFNVHKKCRGEGNVKENKDEGNNVPLNTVVDSNGHSHVARRSSDHQASR